MQINGMGYSWGKGSSEIRGRVFHLKEEGRGMWRGEGNLIGTKLTEPGEVNLKGVGSELRRGGHPYPAQWKLRGGVKRRDGWG